MAKNNSEKKFWEDEPIVVDECEIGSKIYKAQYGDLSDGKFCAAFQPFYVDREGVERRSNGGLFITGRNVETVKEYLDDAIYCLSALRDKIETLSSKNRK